MYCSRIAELGSALTGCLCKH